MSGNTASQDGAALYIGNATVNIVNSTISGNKATSNGGGIAIDPASTPTLSITNGTFFGNSAKSGGGIYRLSAADHAAEYDRGPAASGGNCVGPISNGGGNLQFPRPERRRIDHMHKTHLLRATGR